MAVDLSAARGRLSRIVQEWPPDALPDLLGELARAQAVASVRLHENGAAPAPPTNKLGRHLTADELAELLGVSAKWCYDHADELGAVRLSGRAVRFPEKAVCGYITARTSR